MLIFLKEDGKLEKVARACLRDVAQLVHDEAEGLFGIAHAAQDKYHLLHETPAPQSKEQCV